MNQRICVAGYFPPPITGQTLATERLANLLAPVGHIDRVNLRSGHAGEVETSATIQSDKIARYLQGGKALSAHLTEHTNSTLLWPSISPQALGHTRDMLTIYPALKHATRTFALSHWGNFDRLFHAPATRITSKLLLNRLDGIVFLNDMLAGRSARWIPDEKIFIVPNTIDDTLCVSDNEVQRKRVDRSTRSRLRLLFLSNMIVSKGYNDVLQAIAKLHSQHIAIEARFAGKWISEKDKTQFDNFVSTNNLSSIVQHLGPVSDRQEVKKLHLWADLFVFPTYYPTEAQPLVLLEAMSAGTPVIATPHAGIPDMVRDQKEGLLIPPQNPDAIAKAISGLTNLNQWTTYSQNAQKRFKSTFSPKVVQNRWATLLTTKKP